MRRSEIIIFLILLSFLLGKPLLYAKLVIPGEVKNLDRLSNEAFKKLKYFKYSEEFCMNGRCATTYVEIIPSKKIAYLKTIADGATAEAYVINEANYYKDKDNNWVKLNSMPPLVKMLLELSSGKGSIENCLSGCPSTTPKELMVEEGFIDGKNCYIVNIIYPENMPREYKDNGRIFFDKNNHWLLGSISKTEFCQTTTVQGKQVFSRESSVSIEQKYFDFDKPFDIKLPLEAKNAKEEGDLKEFMFKLQKENAVKKMREKNVTR